ncbi:MAG: alpha/beta fold hydrolase [Caulobacteraceae bacterium]|nr:alpha/beta fold hydrolase [Caulobacteraceae bacterium]
MTDLPMLDGPAVPPLSGGKPRQLVVLLHGLRSNGDDLIGLAPQWREGLPDALWMSPNAVQACADTPGGYQWWDVTSFSLDERAAGARAAAPALNAFLDAQLERHGIPDDKLVLVGFSQGSMMALQVALRRPRPLAGVLAYSGQLVDPASTAREITARPPVTLVHGDRDPVVHAGWMFYSAGALEALGVPLEYHLRPGLQHGIDPGGVQIGRDFIRRVLAD